MYRRAETAVLAVVFAIVCLSGCGMFYRQHTVTFERNDFAPLVSELAATNPRYFGKPFTLIVMVDRRACGARVSESTFWSQWRRHMSERACGFVYATSRADSAGLDYAANLDSAYAPVLVLESFEQRIPHKKNWRAYAPFHFLADSTGKVVGIWPTVFDADQSEQMISEVDSIIAIEL